MSEPRAAMSEPRPRVLAADSSRASCLSLQRMLRSHGFDVSTAAHADGALEAVRSFRPDTIIFDVDLAGADGHAFVGRIRDITRVPILVLSAHPDEAKLVAAFDAGIDEWLAKSVGQAELVARVHALMRRGGAGGGHQLFQSGDLVLDTRRRLVVLAGRTVHLTPTEYALLQALAAAEGRVLTHQELLRQVWGRGYEHEHHILRVNIANVRNKLERNPSRPVYILTAPGTGYSLRKPVSSVLEDEAARLTVKALRVALTAAWLNADKGDHTTAAEAFQEALGLAQSLPDPDAEADSSIGLALALVNLRQFDLAREHVERGRQLAEAMNTPRHLIRVSHVLGLIAHYERRLAEAGQHFLDGFRRFQEIGHPDPGLGGLLLYHLGTTCVEAGDHAGAYRWYEQALALLAPAEDLHRLGLVHLQIGVAYRRRGHYDAAHESLTRAKHIFETLQNTRLLGWANGSIGITLLAEGQLDEAIRHFEVSLRIAKRIGDDPTRARILTELGRALCAKGAFPEAEQALAEAERLAAKFKGATELARIQLAGARLREATGQIEDAVALYARAIASFESHGMSVEFAAASNALGELLLAQNRPAEAAPYLARALRVVIPGAIQPKTES